MNRRNLFTKKKVRDQEGLNKKLELAEMILNKEMAPRKKEAILNFLRGIYELPKGDEKIFEERLAAIIAKQQVNTNVRS